MKTKEEIVKNWLPRYTKRKLEDFGEYILLTNFDKYVELFAERFGTQIPDFLRKSISSGIEAGMIEEKDGHYAATQKGLFRSLYAPLLRLED